MITRRQWAGSARVLQVLNLIGPEGPIAPGGTSREEARAGTQGRNLRQEPQAGNTGRKHREGRKYQAHRPHSTTAPQHHRSPQPQYTVCSQHHYFHITHHIAYHPSIFILSTASTKEKQ